MPLAAMTPGFRAHTHCRRGIVACVLPLLAWLVVPARAETIRVGDLAQMRMAAQRAKAGDRILLAPGEYRGSVWIQDLHGEPDRPIVIGAADPARPPKIIGEGFCIQLSRVSHLEIRSLHFTGARGNGINVDDGGRRERPSHHIALRDLRVTDIGPEGNRDGIKLSGIDDFTVENCVIERWGSGGSGIDMVGCHRGRILNSLFRQGGADGVQCKGGTSEILIQRCTFQDYGHRGVNLGGSTGLEFFRPPVEKMPPNGRYEARNLQVEDCLFIGGTAALAFVGVDGAVARNNTIYRPGRWAFRILQETREPGFVPSRNGVFENNVIVFRSDAWASGGVNIGPGTAPQTFRFARNLWFCEDRPERSRPDLPTPETSGVYGQDPQFRDAQAGDFRLRPGSPAAGRGVRWEAEAGRIPESLVSDSRFPDKPWHPKAPPLPPPAGTLVRANSVDALLAAADGAAPGTTILLADGVYPLPRRLEIRTDRLTLRGESGDRRRVVLDAGGQGEAVALTACSDVTIASLTVRNVRWNGLKINSETGVQRARVYDVAFHNIWQRAIKGVKVPLENRQRLRPTGFRIEYCFFYNDRPKQFSDDPSDTEQTFGGNYIGGIDAMYARDWVIRNNLFIGIKGRTGAGRGAVFLWHESEGCVVERNVIVDCDSGICLGNSHKPEDVPIHAVRCTVQNNVLTRTPENGILADYTRDCRILHNTVHDPASRLRRLIRVVHENHGLVIANNLLSGPPPSLEWEGPIRLESNVTGDFGAHFADAAEGNLRWRADAASPPPLVARISSVPEDIDGRPRSASTCAGAHAADPVGGGGRQAAFSQSPYPSGFNSRARSMYRSGFASNSLRQCSLQK